MSRQLVLSRAAGTAFADFQEEPINFNPTYKYDNGTDIYDTRYADSLSMIFMGSDLCTAVRRRGSQLGRTGR